MKKALDEVNKSLEAMGNAHPDFMGAFSNLMECACNEGSLSHKTKELICIAIAVSKQCHWCIAYHVHKAIEAGATKDEIIESCFVAALMGGGPALMYSQLVVKAMQEFEA
ncbi:carboxymuconolactone decarboxylase family protein [Candidatus Woesearchaeota archaeon]|nr:MAG: carboxymuconolactone decarboxylase family protein [Candidatus Woesearchaeota archaeon]